MHGDTFEEAAAQAALLQEQRELRVRALGGEGEGAEPEDVEGGAVAAALDLLAEGAPGGRWGACRGLAGLAP